MARPRSAVPSYRKHKQSGQAIVTLTDGLGSRHDVLLGPHGTAASRQEYARVIAEWEAAGRTIPHTVATPDITINELMLAYWRFAEGYYRKNGEPTSQLDRIRLALKPVKELYGLALVRDFGPLALKAVRQKMIDAGWVRLYVNACVGCIRRMVKWGVENELVAPSVYHGLQAVAGLKRGRCEAVESQPVRPVADEHVDATLPYLTAPVRAMVQVQRLTGMRPGEVVIMRPCDIDRSSKTVWVYRPASHKTEHHGAERTVFLGPRAQAVLLPLLLRPADAYLFSPREALADLRTRQRQARKTKVQPSQLDRRRRKPQKLPGDRYPVAAYSHAVRQAVLRLNHDRACDACKKLKPADRCQSCQAAAIPHWRPHQLRHNKATEIRREAGLDAARAVLGHRSPAITEVYAELDIAKAAEVMERLG
ncbi:MAG: site-specific integrase [Planctomycetia bacterium]|nr:site-specific integrase [Planctomycetia bacterium]